ncbi:MAG TPA: BadF/BadG/BcrA/BcrD ATPase family protein [Rubricoccaceae bacterium]|nr:BadF/BadG/BcrA/BcrD ATPase family protein [Rubricoccaceae bacterium]
MDDGRRTTDQERRAATHRPPPTVFIGLDAGGTKTALRAEGPGGAFERVGPGVNVRRDGAEAAVRVLAGLVAEARESQPEAPLGGLAAGIAGAGEAADRREIESGLRQALGLDAAVPVAVVHDAEIALEAAFGDGTGVVVIAGTGSIVYARTAAGERLRAGGWGRRLGDDGSGTALGRAALRAACAHRDGGPPTALTAGLAGAHGLDDLDAVLRWTYDAHGDFATLAPLLLAAAEAGDAVAGDALDAETDGLARQAAWLVRRAGGRIEKRVALLGGLTGDATYRRALLQALAHRLPGWLVTTCECEPVEGAVRLARRLGGRER